MILDTQKQPLAFSVKQFCTYCNFSRAWLYLQWQNGKGPRRFKLGSKTLILAQDANSWISSMATENEVQA